MVNLQQKGLVALQDLSKQDILDVLAHAKQFKNGLRKNTLEGKVLASCFFEASTRTRLSFESAVAHLGGKTIGFADSSATSQANKGESFIDTLKMINCYADGLIMRHPNDGAARLASEIMTIPVVNAGDGANQHPTQTLLDLFSIQDSQGQLEDINLGLMGDLKYSRTIHSLIDASKLFKMRLFLIAPPELRIDSQNLMELKRHGISYSFHATAEEVIDKLDCLYLTRLQKERFSAEINCSYGIDLELLQRARPNLRIMHPLPRLEELPTEIDATPYAYYFQQAHNGLFIRQALLDIIFGGSQND
ncbi:MAG TPA: aspartate carbamoyltransferase [Burkholderiales bacterium]|nr:aspartate carbamoyltransferase [Burkholderiales bacterium]